MFKSRKEREMHDMAWHGTVQVKLPSVCEVWSRPARAHSNYIQVHSSIFNYLQHRQIDSHGKPAALLGQK